MTEEIVNLLDILAEKFGTTVDMLWGAMIEQAMLSALAGIFTALFAFIIASVAVKALWKASEDWSSLDQEPARGFAAVALGLVILYAVINIPNLLTQLINPEFWAINHILKMIGS